MPPFILQSLGLSPDTAWPPDHHTLLGLGADATAEEIETAVLERTAKLRTYQLAYPDEVTTALNQLATAMVELTRKSEEPPAVARPEQSAEPAPSFVAAESPVPKYLDIEPEAPPPLPPEPKRRKSRSVRRARAKNAPTQKAAQESPQLPPPLPPVHPPALPIHSPATEYSLLSPPSVPQPLVARLPRPPWAVSPRRRLISDVVRSRARLADWDAAGALLAEPELAAMTRAESVAVVAALRRLAEDCPLAEDGPGGAVLALARSSPGVAALWELSFARRELLCDDWRAGRVVLFAAHRKARAALGHPSIRRAGRRRWQDIRKWATVGMTLAAGALAAVIAFVRLIAPS